MLDTYANDHNRRTNHTMALLHVYGSCGFVLPSLTTAAWLALIVGRVVVSAAEGATAATTWGSMGSWACGGVSPAACERQLQSLAVFSAGTMCMVLALRWMTVVVVSSICELTPGLKSSDLLRRFAWGRLLAGFVVANAVVPVCMAYTFVTRHIEWAGIRYTRRAGKIVAVQHPMAI